jgi:hypothetical protein
MAKKPSTKTSDVAATVVLEFQDAALFEHVSDPVREDLSAIARVGDTLFLSCDETAGIERLTPLTKNHFGHHQHFHLGDWFDLPDGSAGEMDIEGLAADAGWLWVTGSHSLKRKKAERSDNDPLSALQAMEEIERDPNRYFIGRVPLTEVEPGIFALTGEVDGRKAQSVKLKKKASKLIGWLDGDGLLAPFLSLPSKENGFDIEGLAAREDRVWIGLRGPVLRGHACILELEFAVDGDGFLKPAKIDGQRRYRRHLLPTRGLGIRDMYLDGEDLLLLLGPTMSADGPSRVVRWHGAVAERRSGVIGDRQIRVETELPYRGEFDHPEGLEPWPESGEDAYLIVYDSPALDRLDAKSHSVTADVVKL